MINTFSGCSALDCVSPEHNYFFHFLLEPETGEESNHRRRGRRKNGRREAAAAATPGDVVTPLPSSAGGGQKPEGKEPVEVFSKVLMVETENLEHEPFESNNEVKVSGA